MIHHGDLFDVLPTLPEASVDACVTDPPYGLGFMAKEWDVPGGIGAFPMRRRVETDAVNTGASRQGGRQRSGADFARRQKRDAQSFEAEAERWASEVFRVLKPGAHLVSFGGTRTFHRLTAGIEDAGFEIRDCLSWLYGSGFPKSLNLPGGLGTALKPAWEPIIVARKPTQGTVAANVEKHGTAALNIDACRIDAEPWHREPGDNPKPWTGSTYAQDEWTKQHMGVGKNRHGNELGRWPPNVLLDEEAAAMLDEQAPETGAAGAAGAKDDRGRQHGIHDGRTSTRDDVWGAPRDALSGASRFFYVAKPSREERDYGCQDVELQPIEGKYGSVQDGRPHTAEGYVYHRRAQRNIHPTVKPVELMRWLVRLVTPINGTVLDPFTGSGTTGMACRYELRNFIGIEREAEYVAIAERRIANCVPLFGEATA